MRKKKDPLDAFRALNSIYAPAKPAVSDTTQATIPAPHIDSEIKSCPESKEEVVAGPLQVQPVLPPTVAEIQHVDEKDSIKETDEIRPPSIRDQISAMQESAQEGFTSEKEVVTQTRTELLDRIISYVPRCRRLKRELKGQEKKDERAKLCAELLEVLPQWKNAPVLKPNQIVAIPELVMHFCGGQNAITIAATGSGKSYVFGYMIRFARKYLTDVVSPDRDIVLITKTTLVEQATRVILEEFKCKKVFIFSYQTFTTSTMGKMYVKWQTEIVNGQPTLVPKWDEFFKPAFFIFDEVQCLKNEGSQQTRVMLEACDAITDGLEIVQARPLVWSLSATPYSRPIHTKFVVCSLRPEQKMVYGKRRIGKHNYMDWVRSICSSVRPPCTPDEWSPPAMKKIQAVLEDYTVRFDNIQFEKRTIIKQLVIPPSEIEKRIIDEAVAEYIRFREEVLKQPELYGPAAKLVAILQLRKKCEAVRAPHQADKALDAVVRGKNAIVAFAFKDSLDLCKKCLIDAGFPEDEIAEIRGGQSKSGRQRNIDEFQSEKRKIMLMMFSAGGAGLSLHQYNEYNKRPREVYLPPVWNAEELVQILGRAHRINSSSTTYQYIIWYADTIEVDVAEKVKKKCSALKEVVGKREDWTKFFTNDTDDKFSIKRALMNESGEVIDTEEEEDEELDFNLPVSTDEEDAEKPPDEDDDISNELTD